MSDELELLPSWVVEELRRPMTAGAARRARVMERVRACGAHVLPAAERPRTVPPLRRRSWRRRGLASPALGLALAAGVAAIMTMLGVLAPFGRDAAGPSTARATVIGDSITATLHDTLRLVRFVLQAPRASRVALVGDFNGWSRSATPLGTRAHDGEWAAVVALPPGSHRYAFVVDDTQWVTAPPVRDDRPSALAPRRSPLRGGDST